MIDKNIRMTMDEYLSEKCKRELIRRDERGGDID